MALSDQTVSLRKATVADATGIAEVHVLSWRSIYRGIIPQRVLDKLDLSERTEMWRGILSKADRREGHFVAHVNGRVVGFSSAGPSRDEELAFDGELYAIYLLEEFHNRGIGRKLFDRAVASLKEHGLESLAVWVFDDNPTCGFYERLGGERVADKIYDLDGEGLRKRAYGWPVLTP